MLAYTADIWKCRYFWLSLVKMDLRTRYRRSVLGLGWSLLHPIAMTAVICTVFHQLFNQPVASYGPFLLSGITTWGFLSSVITQGCDSFYRFHISTNIEVFIGSQGEPGARRAGSAP